MKKSYSATLIGNEAHLVCVEASFTKGLPSFSIVGLASSAIQESKERVKSALLHDSFVFPPLRITLNLSPSDIQKDGTQFDLPIALLIALQQSSLDLSQWAIFGELGLDGTIKASSHTFALLLSFATQFTGRKVLVPASMSEALSNISALEIYPVNTLKEAIGFLQSEISITPIASQGMTHPSVFIAHDAYMLHTDFSEDFIDVKGQERAKKAAILAAAGGHNLLLEGNPGSGKSMIAKRLVSILPPLTQSELLVIAKSEALQGKTPSFSAKRPFRSPHHSATLASIFGGGSGVAKIGEAGLAHLGILFFDELPHYAKQVLEALREPLEDKKILISRVNSKIEYPTDFTFIAAMNPCPCGNLLSTSKACRCSEIEIKRYKNRLSDPLLDRIDLFVTMQETTPHDKPSLNSKQMQSQVIEAFTMQKKRGQTHSNANLEESELKSFCNLDEATQNLLDQAVIRYGLSARSINKVKKVARTLADLEQREHIASQDLLEALSYRRRTI